MSRVKAGSSAELKLMFIREREGGEAARLVWREDELSMC